MHLKVTSKLQVTFPKRMMEQPRICQGHTHILAETDGGLLLKSRRFDVGKLAPLRGKIPRGLESWYLGDLAAVEAGLGATGLARHQHKTPFDKPDDLASPARKLQSIAPAYQKVGGSRAIGPHLAPDNKRSRSFGVFVEGLRKLAAQ